MSRKRKSRQAKAKPQSKSIVQANRQFKSSLFASIFSEKEYAVSLFNALSGQQIAKVKDIELKKLDTSVFKGLTNDVSFLVGKSILVLIEHQSTLNWNMAARMLEYYSHLLDMHFGSKGFLAKAPIDLPEPLFIVLYNGTEELDDHTTLRIETSFITRKKRSKWQKFMFSKNPKLTLEVEVYNINAGTNLALLEKCEALAAYSRLVALSRRFESEGMELSEAVLKAIDICIEENLLAGYFSKYKAEVLNMLLDDLDKEGWERLTREQEKELEEKAKAIEEKDKAIEESNETLYIAIDTLLQNGYSKQEIIDLLKLNSAKAKALGLM